MSSIIGPDFIFIHKPKTGGGSIYVYLKEIFNKECHPLAGHIGILDASRVVTITDNLLRFGCVRNPFDWYVSWWKFIIAHGRSNYRRIFNKFNCRDNFPNFLKFVLTTSDSYGIRYDFSIMRELEIGVCTYLFIKAYCNYEKVFAGDKNKMVDNIGEHFLMNLLIEFDYLDEGLFEIFELSKQEGELWLSSKKKNATVHDHYST